MMRWVACCCLLIAGAAAQDRREVGAIEFSGASSFPQAQLRSLLQTQESPGVVWQWLFAVSENFGNPPSYVDGLTVESDTWALRRFYEDQGFFHASVDARIVPAGSSVTVRFDIREGPRASIDSVSLLLTNPVHPPVEELLRRDALIAAGDPFVLSLVEAEFRRLIDVFSNHGYVNVQALRKQAVGRDSSTAFWVVFEFDPGQQHTFGSITILHDTASAYRIDDDVILRHLDFRPGDTYSEAKKSESERLLNRLGVFELARLDVAGQEAADSLVRVPMHVSVRARSFQELTPEVGFNDEDNAFNALVGLGYRHRNFFGGARNFNTFFRFSVRSIESARLGRLFASEGLRDSSLVSKVELSMQLTQPYFFSNTVSLTSSLSGILDKQKSFYIPTVRGKIGVIAQSDLTRRYIADWNLEWIDPTSVSTSRDTTLRGFEPQFNSILTLTYQRDFRNDIFSPSEGALLTFVAEEAGVLPRLYRSLGGVPLPYAQYVKFMVLTNWYWDPGEEGGPVFAAKFNAGNAQLYAPSPAPVPITRRFFSGGSGSVRGWKARELGATTKPAEGGNAMLESSVEVRLSPFRAAGDFLFLEPRKISFTLFADAGNMWADKRDFRFDHIALATGFGLRYNTVAGPIRIDFGLKVYDPFAAEDRRWITQKRFFNETFAGGVIHLGIGHAF